MISMRQLNEKTYEDMMEEAVRKIPLYSDEWTNFNPSDPGITILENLSSFNELQQTYVNTITAQIQEKLLKLTGFVRKPGSLSRVLLECPHMEEAVMLPANQSFRLGDVSFETNHAMELYGYQIIGIFGDYEDTLHDMTYLTDREIPLSGAVFGANPKTGNHIYFITDGLPKQYEETIFYCQITDNHHRNPFKGNEKKSRMFAEIKWECLTEAGYQEIAYKDTTGCFVNTGELHFRMPEAQPVICEDLPVKGYCIRGTLQECRYDIAPQLMVVKGFLFEVWQKETLSICNTFNKISQVEVACDLLEEGYSSVFCKEEKGSSYRMYREQPDPGAKGRYYLKTRDAYGHYTFEFDKRKFKYGPARIKNAIKIVAYSEYIMRRYNLGVVIGFDNQEIDLPVTHLVPESFSIIAERVDENGESLYDFVKPNRLEEDALTFTIDENAGRITIIDPGDFIEAKLYLCACATTQGEAGNICENNAFYGEGLDAGVVFHNPGEGRGGCFRESLEDVRKRFAEDVNTPATVVTAVDYEKLISQTPGLCIDKAKAYVDAGKHLVNVVVKPVSEEKFPKLSQCYIDAIREQIEERRLVSTVVHILQPMYVAIHVSGTIYIKPHVERAQEEIEAAIRKNIDYATSGRNFGEAVKFDELFHTLEGLDCVAYVYDLNLRPQNAALASVQRMDVKPSEQCLCYPGELNLEILTYHK